MMTHNAVACAVLPPTRPACGQVPLAASSTRWTMPLSWLPCHWLPSVPEGAGRIPVSIHQHPDSEYCYKLGPLSWDGSSNAAGKQEIKEMRPRMRAELEQKMLFYGRCQRPRSTCGSYRRAKPHQAGKISIRNASRGAGVKQQRTRLQKKDQATREAAKSSPRLPRSMKR